MKIFGNMFSKQSAVTAQESPIDKIHSEIELAKEAVSTVVDKAINTDQYKDVSTYVVTANALLNKASDSLEVFMKVLNKKDSTGAIRSEAYEMKEELTKSIFYLSGAIDSFEIED